MTEDDKARLQVFMEFFTELNSALTALPTPLFLSAEACKEILKTIKSTDQIHTGEYKWVNGVKPNFIIYDEFKEQKEKE